ncbi:Nucleotidyltransferase [Dentipellis sp. KUC8613]|nr:Nucleotidyltransferase [Dentipellis sp. KUC8613]
MPFKRPNPHEHSSESPLSESSNSATPAEPSTRGRAKRPKLNVLKGVKLYVLQAKMTAAEIGELYGLAERGGAEICKDVEDAELIITNVSMRKRLERHIDWNVAKSKSLVTPAWLRESIRKNTALPCGDFAALSDLSQTTTANCTAGTDTDGEAGSSVHPSPTRATSAAASHHPPRTSPQIGSIPKNLLPPDPPYQCDTSKLDYLSRFSCCRASPLVCPNQKLCEMLDVMRKTRELEGEDRSSLSYQRAVSVIKAFPRKITHRRDAEKLPYIGTKLITMIEEYIDTGHITEVETTLASTRYHTLTAFTTIYGIGPKTARQLYGLGLRTIEHLEAYYNVEPTAEHGNSSGEAQTPAGTSTEAQTKAELENDVQADKEKEPEGTAAKEMHGVMLDSDEDAHDVMEENWIKIALGLRHDLAKKIPRDEVEEIHRVVMKELDDVEPGCVSTIVGGYRRGKEECGDVDIVFTHSDPERARGLCKRFVRRLYDKGIVTHVMHLSGFHAHNALRTTHWDSLEKALSVFVLPGHKTRRRVDFIFAQPETYWTAVVGWTGSTMFERDLRLWAKGKGLKFDSSGITRRRDSKLIFPKTEKDVFDVLGLPWIDPTLRNADL